MRNFLWCYHRRDGDVDVNFLWCYHRRDGDGDGDENNGDVIITSPTFEKCKKECNMLSIILVQDFCPLKIKITQFPGGFPLYLTHCKNHWEFSIAFEWYCSKVDL